MWGGKTKGRAEAISNVGHTVEEEDEAVPHYDNGILWICVPTMPLRRRPQNKEPNCYEPLVVRVLIVVDPGTNGREILIHGEAKSATENNRTVEQKQQLS